MRKTELEILEDLATEWAGPGTAIEMLENEDPAPRWSALAWSKDGARILAQEHDGKKIEAVRKLTQAIRRKVRDAERSPLGGHY